MRFAWLTFLISALAALSTTRPAAAQGQAAAAAPQASNLLTTDIAQTIAQEALSKCRADGYKVSVLVVDSLNAPKVLIRDDGASTTTPDVAKMKATASIVYNRPSGPAPPAPGTPAPPPSRPGAFFFGNGMNAQGAVPIKAGDATIGAVAVSGAPGGDKDVACASAGLAKVAEKLK
jgi:uncharacterized protein GlcG (DUF336 family)